MKYLKEKTKIFSWLKVMRMSQGFFFISITPILISCLLLLYHFPSIEINIIHIVLALFVCLLFHLGADMINEYYDYKKGNHIGTKIKTPFNGGTRVLDEKKLEAKKVLKASYLFFFLGLLLSLPLIYYSSFLVLAFVLLGVFSAWSYSSPPFSFSYRGLGEILIFLNNGFFIMGFISLIVLDFLPYSVILLPSCILGFMGLAIIMTNEIPDYKEDKKVHKKNIVVRFGRKFLLF